MQAAGVTQPCAQTVSLFPGGWHWPRAQRSVDQAPPSLTTGGGGSLAALAPNPFSLFLSCLGGRRGGILGRVRGVWVVPTHLSSHFTQGGLLHHPPGSPQQTWGSHGGRKHHSLFTPKDPKHVYSKKSPSPTAFSRTPSQGRGQDCCLCCSSACSTIPPLPHTPPSTS